MGGGKGAQPRFGLEIVGLEERLAKGAEVCLCSWCVKGSRMTTKWKVAVVAAGLSLSAGELAAKQVPSPRPRPQPSADRIASLKSALDAQSQRLDAAAASLAQERAEVERQKQELQTLQSGGTASTDQLASTQGKGLGDEASQAPAPGRYRLGPCSSARIAERSTNANSPGHAHQRGCVTGARLRRVCCAWRKPSSPQNFQGTAAGTAR